MLVPFLIFLTLSYLSVRDFGWYSAVPILFMLLLLALIYRRYRKYSPANWLRLDRWGQNPFFEGMYKMGRPWPETISDAVKAWGKAADEGIAEAQFNLGLMHDRGLGVPKDKQKALGWYRKAALKGDAKALYNLGLLYQLGGGVPCDIHKAAALFEKAAIRCDTEAMLALACLYESGDELPQDTLKSAEWYARAALQEDKNAAEAISRLYDGDEDIIESAMKNALEWYERNGAGGNAEAQYIAGYAHEMGMHFNYLPVYTPDRSKSFAIGFRKGIAHKTIIPEDAAKAMEWYRKAASLGHSDAMFSLGRMYNQGEKARKDSAKAVKWLEKASEAGNAGAMYELYEIYKMGLGVPQDPQKAREWLKKAADNDHFLARMDLNI